MDDDPKKKPIRTRKAFILYLSEKERDQLDSISADYEMTCSRMLRELIRAEHRRMIKRSNTKPARRDSDDEQN